MNVLIVDDDRFVVASLEKGLDWSALGFENVYTAYNITSAQTIIQDTSIHLLISDIDMPLGSGLDLLTWMRDRNDDTPVIFLTNYADFHYAQKAIELKTFHYFLKPIEFDQLECIIRDVTSHLQNVQDLQRKKYENFWQTFLHQNAEHTKTQLLAQLHQSELPTAMADTIYVPILVDAFPYYLAADHSLKSCFAGTGEQLDYFKTTFFAMFSDFINSESVFFEYQQQNNRYLAILSVPEAAVSPLLLMSCENYVQLVAEQTNCSINCLVGVPSSPENFHRHFSDLHTMLTNRLDCQKQVLSVSEYKQAHGDFPALDTKMLDIYLNNSQFDAFSGLCQQYLQDLSSSRSLYSLSMTNFQVDLVQVVHSFLKSKEIPSNKVFNDDSYHLLSRLARTSLQAMELYMQYMIHTLETYLKTTAADESQVASMKNYIDQHFTEEISLAILADLFFMDPDYTSKLFKKEYGISIKNYIINQRIEAAKELLSATGLPVNTIALNVGYGNYSYFTRLFKKVTNQTPLEFRSQVNPSAQDS